MTNRHDKKDAQPGGRLLGQLALVERKLPMKPLVLVVALAGLLACTSASFAQTSPHPFTSSRTAVAAAPAQRFNLNGIWQFRANGRTFNAQFEQQGDQFKSFVGIGNLGRPEALLFEGRYANGVIVGQRITEANTRVAETLTVEDPDHVRTSRGIILLRISPARADDAICDLQNSSHTRAGYAFDRAIDASRKKPLPLAIEQCWVRVSADQGNPRAQDAMAMFFRDGEGVSQNSSIAFSWAQKSAAQGDPVGEALVADFYNRGIGVTKDAQLARQWQAKADAQTAQQREVARAQQAEHQKQLQEMLGTVIVSGIINGMFGGDASPSSESPESQWERDNEEDRERKANWESLCTMNGGGMDACANAAVYK
jgi:hypothetical protein